VLRDKKGDAAAAGKSSSLPPPHAWKGALVLDLAFGVPIAAAASSEGGIALVLRSLDEVRAVVEKTIDLGSLLRAVVAPFVPSTAVAALASEGIATFELSATSVEALKGSKSLSLPEPASWSDKVQAIVGEQKIEMTWLATGSERTWTHAGTARGSMPQKASKA
jgi:aconitate hydratase